MKIAIIGAGLSGLTCALEAVQAGHEVTVFDKGRGPGGRLSTRRIPGPAGDVHFDHGTIGFKTRTSAFSDAARVWLKAGWIGLWEPRLARLDKSGITDIPNEKFVIGTPAMNSLIKGLAGELKDVRFGARIKTIEKRTDGWRLHFEDETPDFDCEAIVCAVPSEQAAILLAHVAPALAEEAQHATSLPCWTVMLGYDAQLDFDYDLVLGSGRPFTRLVRNCSKPGRDSAEAWVLQAGPDWSAEHIDLPRDEITRLLQTEFETATGITSAPTIASAHRWLYALNAIPADTPFSWEKSLNIGTCGDWHLGAEVEHAWTSGSELGKHLAGL